MILTSVDAIQNKIYFIRGHKVMLDNDLAKLYRVETFNLNKSVQRNIKRFPPDFMFQLTREETLSLTFQIGMSKSGRGGRRTLPYAFTQEGVSMLSGILHSERAVEVNIAIMRAFVRMGEILSANSKLAEKLRELENKLIAHDYQIEDILRAIRKLMRGPQKSKPKIGYL
jgi:hypothetical protein